METDNQNPPRSNEEDTNLGHIGNDKLSVDNDDESAQIETIDTDNDIEQKVNETSMVDPFPRANEAGKVEMMDSDSQNPPGFKSVNKNDKQEKDRKLGWYEKSEVRRQKAREIESGKLKLEY